MPRPSPSALADLQHDFRIACDYFDLSAEARDIAWRAAERHFQHAGTCYRAIANSLRVIDLGAKVRAAKPRKKAPS